MKRFFGFVIVCILFSVSALAASNSQTIKFNGAVQVGSTVLPAGDYKVSWTGTGASAKVTLEKKGIPSVTVPATVVEQKSNHIGISTDSQSGKDVLKSIILSNVSLTL
ncbi:MAG: hypothetical protein P4K86_12375 [Terracidiphilus sp.]|nr:hypothetical protein [Terracidiphilus sp.]MDR3777225.1 hypothetical protein [Terracidiphilus sp.]